MQTKQIIILLLLPLLSNGQPPTSKVTQGTAWEKHFTINAAGMPEDVCDTNPSATVCECPCDSDLITIEQTLAGARGCIYPDKALTTASYEATGRSPKRCLYIGLTPVDGVCGTVKKCSSNAGYTRPACSTTSAADGEKCPKLDETGTVNYAEAAAFCNSAGMRMCSLPEIQNGKHLKDGDTCNMQTEYVWTKTTCGAGKGDECNAGVTSFYVTAVSPSGTAEGQAHCVGSAERTTTMSTTTSSSNINLSGGNDASATNLQRCAGECDDDDQCAAGLKCFQRQNNEPIPGCNNSPRNPSAGGRNDWDYCYDPSQSIPVRSIYPACCADSDNDSERWNLAYDDIKDSSCGHEVNTAQWSQENKLPWNGDNTGYKSSAVFSGSTPSVDTVPWTIDCTQIGSRPDLAARCRTMHGPIFGNNVSPADKIYKYFNVPVNKAVKISLRVWANDVWDSGDRLDVKFGSTTTTQNGEIPRWARVLTWSKGRNSSDPNWSKYNNADMMFEPGKVSWSSNPTGGTCFSFVELELPASFNTNVNQVALQIECKVDDSSFSNWQTTNSGSQIRVGYCGFDMVQVWTTDDTLGSTDVAEADAYKWGVTVLTEQHNDFTSSSKNTNQKQLEMGDWVYKTGLNPNERIVVTPSESGTNAKRVVVGDGASRGSFNDDKYRQCGQSGSPVNPCEEMHVGFVSRINVQSISKEFTLPAHGNNEGQRTGKIKIEFRSWAIDSWDNGETSWLTVDGNVNAAWTGTAKSCIWSNAATASDSSPPQSSTWVKDTSIDVYQPWGYNRGNRGMVCYIDVELWVAVDDTATKITLDFQSTVDQSSGDEYWGFNRLKISTAIIGPDAGNCPGAGCGANCLNLPGTSDTAMALGLCSTVSSCTDRTWPTFEECLNPANSKCVPSPRGNAVGTYKSTCDICGGDFWCARNENGMWPTFNFQDPARDPNLISLDNIYNREVTRISIVGHGSMGADGITSSNKAQISLNTNDLGRSHDMKGNGIDGKWQCGDCFETKKIEVDSSVFTDYYNYHGSNGGANALKVLPDPDFAWCLSKITLRVCARPGPATIDSITRHQSSETINELNPNGGSQVKLIGKNLGPIITSITFGPEGEGFNVEPSTDCAAPSSDYTSIVCTVPKGIGSNHKWKVGANKVRVSAPSSSTTSYKSLSLPTLSPATDVTTGGDMSISLSSSDASPYPTELLSGSTDLQVQALVRVASPTILRVTSLVVSGTTVTVTHDTVADTQDAGVLTATTVFSLTNLGYANIETTKLHATNLRVTGTPTNTAFTFEQGSTDRLADGTYTMKTGYKGVVAFWPTDVTKYHMKEVLPSINVNTFEIQSEQMNNDGMAIFGVKLQINMLVTGTVGTLGESTTGWSTYRFKSPSLTGNGARTDEITESGGGNSFIFSVDAMNLGSTSSELGAPGHAKLCKSTDQTTPGNGDCKIVEPTSWSHNGASFSRGSTEWVANDFPGTLQLWVGIQSTQMLTIVQAPPSFLDDDNKAEIRVKKCQTNGMELETPTTRDTMTLKVFNVGDGSGTSLENSLFVFLEIDSASPTKLYGCTSDGKNYDGVSGCTASANAPASLTGAAGWKKGTCADDSSVPPQKYCEIIVYVPEGQGTNIPVYVSYGSANSGTIGFGGYELPSVDELKLTNANGEMLSGQPELNKCIAAGAIDATGGVLYVSGNNFGKASPTFEFCVFDPVICEGKDPEECCTTSLRWREHPVLSSPTPTHETLSLTIAPGLGKNHLLRVKVGGQYSEPAAVCFKPPTLVSVTEVPSVLLTGAAPGGTNAGSPGKLVLAGLHFGNPTSIGWDDTMKPSTREQYVMLYRDGEDLLADGKTNKYNAYRVHVFVDESISLGTLTSWTNSQIEFQIPAGEGADHAVAVEIAKQKSVEKDAALNFNYDVPTITNVDPPFGPTDGTTLITINGTNFGTQDAIVTIHYYFETQTFVRIFDASQGHQHDHVHITNIAMPAGQGKKNVEVTVTISGQTSERFSILPPSTPVSIVGYPGTITLTGPYLPPLVTSMTPSSGPTSGCDRFEDASEWRKRFNEDTSGSTKRECKKYAEVTFIGSSFGLGGTKGDAQVEMRTVGGKWDALDVDCVLPNCEIIATDVDGNMLTHTHEEIKIRAPRGLGAERQLRLRVGGQLLPGNEQDYSFKRPKDMVFNPIPIDALGTQGLEVTADDGFGEEASDVNLTIGGKPCADAVWQPLHPESGRPYITCSPAADVAGAKDILLYVALTEHEYPVNTHLEYNTSELFSICMGGMTDLRTGDTKTYYGRPCNAVGSMNVSDSFLNRAPCVDRDSGKGERCLECPDGALCFIPGIPWRDNTERQYTYFDPTAKEGFWRSKLFLDSDIDVAEIETRKHALARYKTMDSTTKCGVRTNQEDCETLPIETSSDDVSCEWYNRTLTFKGGAAGWKEECVNKNYPHALDKRFVFDFVPCEPPNSCVGNNKCGPGYEGVLHMCNDWYEKESTSNVEIRSCSSDYDCMTKSGNLDILPSCSHLRPQDCAICDFWAATNATGGTEGTKVGQCKCTASPRCGLCTRSVPGLKNNGTEVEGYHRINGECAKCPTNLIVIVVVFILALVFGMMGAAWLESKKVNMAFIPIGVDYFQVLAIFTGSNIPWPSYFKDILAVFSFFNIDIDIAAPECLDPNMTYAVKFVLTMSAPLVVLFLMFLLFVFKLIKASFCKSCCRQEKFDWRWYISIFLIIVYFLYLTVTRRALEIFTCNPTTPDDGFMWATFSSPECPYGLCRCYDSTRHEATKDFYQANFIGPAITFLCIYTLGFPLLVLFIVIKNKRAIKLDQLLRAYDMGDTQDEASDQTWEVRVKYHQLYYHYKPGKVYWLLWVIYRKVAIAVVAVVFYSNPGFQLALTILILFSAYVLQVRNKPYMSEVERLMEVAFHEHEVEEQNEKHMLMESAILNVKRRKEAQQRQSGRRGSAVILDFANQTMEGGRGKLSSSKKKNRTGQSKAQQYFFDYNTVELILLGSAIVVCASGIMFTTGQFSDERSDNLWQRDLIGTVVVIIVVLSMGYYLIVVISELCGDEDGCGCINMLVRFCGRQDRNAQLQQKQRDAIDDGDIEMNANPLNNSGGADQKELERLKEEATHKDDTNKALMDALRHQKNKNAQTDLHAKTPKGKGRKPRRQKREFAQKKAGDGLGEHAMAFNTDTDATE